MNIKTVTPPRLPSGSVTTVKRRGRPPGSTNQKGKGKRSPGRPSGTTRGNAAGLLSLLLTQNGFTDGAKITVTEGRKTVALPVGFFTGR